ncbi:MAG: hypothetical protein ACTHLN_11940 [Tepidisphaeraceae bacterium]
MSLIESLEHRTLFAFGAADTTFAGDGAATNGQDGAGLDATALTDGRIALLAEATGGTQIDVYTSAGTLDPSFGGGDGIITVAGGATQIKAAPGGKMLVFSAGGVSRYTASGALDSSFGTSGYQAVTVAADGSFYLVDTNEIVRYTSGGIKDTAFGSNGFLEFASGPTTGGTRSNDDQVNSLTIMPDGKIEVAGLRLDESAVYIDPEATQLRYTTLGTSLFVARFNADGSADTSFGTNGIYLVPFTSTTAVSPSSVFIQSQSDGTSLVAYTYDGRVQTIFISTAGGGKGSLRVTGTREGVVTGVFNTGAGTAAIAIRSPWAANSIYGNLVAPAARSGNVWTLGDTVSANTVTNGNMRVVGADASGRLVITGAEAPANAAHFDQVGRLLSTGSVDPVAAGNFANGQQNTLAVDSAGQVHLAYYDAATKTLKYALRDQKGGWSAVETIDATLNSGLYLSIGIVGDTPAVAYFDGTDGDLIYATRNSDGTWTRTVVDHKGSTGLYPSLHFSDDGRPYIAYYAKSTGDLRLAYQLPNTSAWTIEAIDTVGDTGRSPSLAVDAYRNTFAIAYAGPDNTVKLAERKGSGWVSRVVAQTTGGVGAVSLGFERRGLNNTATATAPVPTVIAYYDAGPADLVIARRPAGATQFSATRIASKGATGLYPTFLQTSPVISGHAQGIDEVVYWDRRSDQIRFGLDQTFNSQGVQTGAAAVDPDILALAGGKYLSAAFDNDSSIRVLAYLDTASNRLVVRNV